MKNNDKSKLKLSNWHICYNNSVTRVSIMSLSIGVFEHIWNRLTWNWKNIGQPPCCQCRWSQHQPTISHLSRPLVTDRVNMTPFLLIKNTTHTTHNLCPSKLDCGAHPQEGVFTYLGIRTWDTQITTGTHRCDDALGWRGAFGHYEEADRDFVGTRYPTQDIVNLCGARGKKAGKEKGKALQASRSNARGWEAWYYWLLITWHFWMHSADPSTNVTLFGFCQATDCHRPLLSTRPWRTNVAPSNVEATWRSYMRFRSLNSLQAVRSSHIPHHPTSADPKAEQEQNLCDKIRPVCQV